MTDASELESLEMVLQNGDNMIVDIKQNLDNIISTSSFVEDFDKQMYFYIEYEKLISIRLDQLLFFIDDTDNLNSQADTLSTLKTNMINEIKQYEGLVAQNNELSLKISLILETVNDRLDNLAEISKNIKETVIEFINLVKIKRDSLEFVNVTTFLIPLKFVQTIDLTDLVTIDLTEYMVQPGEYNYSIFIDNFKNASLNDNILEIKRSGNIKKYYIVIHVTDNNSNYNFITLPISESSIEIVIQLQDELYILDFNDYLNNVNNYNYEIINNPYNNTNIVNDKAYIRGSFLDSRYNIQIDVTDDDEKITFVILVFEYTSPPIINKPFNYGKPLILVDEIYVYNLNDYVSHPYLTLNFLVEEGLPSNVILEPTTGILKIMFSDKSISYKLNIKVVTKFASTLNNQTFFEVDIIEPSPKPKLHDTFYPIDVQAKTLKYVLKDEEIFINLLNCFVGNNIIFDVDNRNFHPGLTFNVNTSILIIKGDYNQSIFNIFITATNPIGSDYLQIIIDESEGLPLPLTLISVPDSKLFFILDRPETKYVPLYEYINLVGDVVYTVQDDLFTINNNVLELVNNLKDGLYQFDITASNHYKNPTVRLTFSVFEYGVVPRILYDLQGNVPTFIMYDEITIDPFIYFYGNDIKFSLYSNDIYNYSIVTNSDISFYTFNYEASEKDIEFQSYNDSGNGDILTIKLIQISTLFDYNNWVIPMQNTNPLTFVNNVETNEDNSIVFIERTNYGETNIISSHALGWTFEIIFKFKDSLPNSSICKFPFNEELLLYDKNILMSSENILLATNVNYNCWYHLIIIQNGIVYFNGVQQIFSEFQNINYIDGKFVIGNGFHGYVKVLKFTPSNNVSFYAPDTLPINSDPVVIDNFDPLIDPPINTLFTYRLDNHFQNASFYEIIVESTDEIKNTVYSNCSISTDSFGFDYLTINIAYVYDDYKIVINAYNVDNVKASSSIDIFFKPTLYNNVPVYISIITNTSEINLLDYFRNSNVYTYTIDPEFLLTPQEQNEKINITNDTMKITGSSLNTTYSLIVTGENPYGTADSLYIYVSEGQQVEFPSNINIPENIVVQNGDSFTWSLQNSAFDSSKTIYLFDGSLSTWFIFNPFTVSSTDPSVYNYSGTRKTGSINGVHSMIKFLNRKVTCIGYIYVVTSTLGPHSCTILASNDDLTFVEIARFEGLENRSQELKWENNTSYYTYYVVFTKAYNASIQLANNRFYLV